MSETESINSRSQTIYIWENEMKRPFTFILLGILLLGLVIFPACAPLNNAPAQATQIAQTVVAGAATVQSAGNTIQTILTPISSPTPAATPDLTTVCIPPLNMKVMTEVTLTDGRRITALNGFITVFKANGGLESALQVPAEVATPLTDQDITIKTFRCESTNVVYYDPSSVE